MRESRTISRNSHSSAGPRIGALSTRCRFAARSLPLNPSHQDKNEQDDDDKAEPAAAVVTGAVERSAADAAEAAQQGDHQDDQNDSADTHRMFPPNDAAITRTQPAGSGLC